MQRSRLVSAAVLLAVACAAGAECRRGVGYIVASAEVRVRLRVLDAGTGEPLRGAMVQFGWDGPRRLVCLDGERVAIGGDEIRPDDVVAYSNGEGLVEAVVRPDFSWTKGAFDWLFPREHIPDFYGVAPLRVFGSGYESAVVTKQDRWTWRLLSPLSGEADLGEVLLEKRLD